VSLQRKGSWRHRSLIDDARFDTEINAELSKEDEQQALKQVADGDAGAVGAANDVFSNGSSSTVSQRSCAIILSARDAATLSRIFKVFEV